MPVKTMSLKEDFSFPDYSPYEYQCPNCSTQMKLYKYRVLYCRRCHKGFLHPRYDFAKDTII